MTRQNDIPFETSSFADKNKSFSVLAMWCKNCDLPLLGDPLCCGYENDYIKEHQKPYGEGLVDGT